MGRCVVKVLATLESLHVLGEVVVADNGSSDELSPIAENSGVRIIHVTQEGYGNALQAGIAAARGRFIVFMDADDSFDFSQLEPYIARLRVGEDFVFGNWFRGRILPGAMPRPRSSSPDPKTLTDGEHPAPQRQRQML